MRRGYLGSRRLDPASPSLAAKAREGGRPGAYPKNGATAKDGLRAPDLASVHQAILGVEREACRWDADEVEVGLVRAGIFWCDQGDPVTMRQERLGKGLDRCGDAVDAWKEYIRQHQDTHWVVVCLGPREVAPRYGLRLTA